MARSHVAFATRSTTCWSNLARLIYRRLHVLKFTIVHIRQDEVAVLERVGLALLVFTVEESKPKTSVSNSKRP
eukprot:12894528-Prorocentrum_lima.AAC.1